MDTDLNKKLQELKRRDQLAEQGGGAARRERQAQRGRCRRASGSSFSSMKDFRRD